MMRERERERERDRKLHIVCAITDLSLADQTGDGKTHLNEKYGY
jgi:hypothetical protein